MASGGVSDVNGARHGRSSWWRMSHQDQRLSRHVGGGSQSKDRVEQRPLERCERLTWNS